MGGSVDLIRSGLRVGNLLEEFRLPDFLDVDTGSY